MSGENAVQDVRGGGESPGCTSPYRDAEGGETPAERRQGILDGVGCKPLWSSASLLGTEKRGRGWGLGGGHWGSGWTRPRRESECGEAASSSSCD